MAGTFGARKGMARILDGIIKYRQTLRPSLLEEFKKVATGPSPEGLLLTCVDSRVVASRITQAAPGQLFIVRNPGTVRNLVPHHNCFRNNVTVGGECGALELACSINKVQVIAVIGHSDCKAMNLLYSVRNDLKSPSKGPLEDWLRFHARGTLEQFKKLESATGFDRKLIFHGAQHYEDDFEAYIDPYNQFKPSDKFSQINTLEQLQNFLTYPFLKERLNRNELEVHALWTDISKGECLCSFRRMKFILSRQINCVILLLITVTIVVSSHKRTTKKNESFNLKPRIDCYPESESPFSNYSKEACLARNCLYDDDANSSTIQCYLSSNYGYILQTSTKQNNNIQLKLKRNQAIGSMFPDPIENVILEVQQYTNDIIRFKLYDADEQRYEVPIPLTPPSDQVNSAKYEFNYSSDSSNNNIISFSIKRRKNQAILFDTSLGGLVLNNQFLQIITRLQSSHVYGFGENNHDSLKHNVTAKSSWGIFARDQGTNWDTNSNHYGQHPFYLVMEQTSDDQPSGCMHGVLLLNSNAMDYSFDSTPSLTLRTIGGILDFFVFLGPKPEQVIQQYTWLVGRPFLPPYWSLGFQLSRWDYSNLTHMQMVNKRNLDAGIPLDVQYADIDYMDAAKVFTIDPIRYKGMKEYFEDLQSEGVRTIIILDPGMVDDQNYYVPTIEGIEEDVFIKWDNGSIMRGAVWPGPVFFPDYFTERTQNWWKRWITNFRSTNLTFDGLWIDMNEPALFETNDPFPWNWLETGSNYTLKCPQNQWENPPYRTKAVYRWDKKINRTSRLSDRTLCMSALQGEIDSTTNKPLFRHYDVHSLYGWSQTKPTLDVLQKITGKRSMVLPRSTFVGSGQWAGHWLGDNEATWHEMKRSLIGMIEFNWFGIPYNGADICGFDKTPTEEMCIRWMQVGAFYPFSRNHNIWKTPDQDPAAWSSSAISIMVEALRIRYTLLPYYYTLFYKSHINGSTVIRPLFHEYPTDKNTLDIFLQFLIGSNIMIAPVTDEGARQVQVYIPSSEWFNYYTGDQYLYSKQFINISAALDTIPILLRSGSIIPTQQYANNTKYSRLNPFGLIIILNSNGNAQGDLFYDDGESINTIGTKSYYYSTFQWSSSNQQLIINVIENNYSFMSNLILDTITIYGLKTIPTIINVNNKEFAAKVRPFTQIVDINNLGLAMDQSYIFTWTNTASMTIEPREIIFSNPKYRVDCFPDPDVTSNACFVRGCIYDPISQSDYPACYIPSKKGGYVTSSIEKISNTTTQYKLSRLSKKPAFISTSKSNINYRIDSRYPQSNLTNIVTTDSDEFSIYGHDIDHLNLQVSVSGTDMIRLTIRDKEKDRYEVPVPIHWHPSVLPTSITPKIQFEMTKTLNEQAGFRIKRTDTQSIIFDTSSFAHGFIYDNQYIQFITTIPSRNVYGFGENTHSSFRHILQNSLRYGIFARDQPPQGGNENLYGTHPFYMSIERDGQAFGVLILNSNAQDYKLDEFENDQSMLTYRTIGGILDIFFFAGPRPEDVIRQYQLVIGFPFMPPYWALGFQLCRYGYDTLENMKAAMQRTLDGNIPIDIQYGDIDYFRQQLDFTWDPIRFKGLPEYIDWLHTQGMKFITILDPAIDSEESNYTVFTEGQQADIWIKWPERRNVQFNETKNNNMIGYVWPYGKSVFPDYLYPPTKDWWTNQILNYHKKIKFDGLWIDMNEPANSDTNKFQPWNWPHAEPWNLHCPMDEQLENPRYKTAIHGDSLSDKTLCMIAEQRDGHGKVYNHYDVHNLYGWSETLATLPATHAIENKRSIIISRSTFPTSGAYGGHWLGDNTAAWPHLKHNIIGMLEFNLFGIPYIGADICGFEGNTTEQMCQRWMQLGAFNPFFRNHNGIRFADHDPGSFSPSIVDSNRRVVETRYGLIPYLYTLFHRVHISGGTVVRSMAHEFPNDSTCWSIDEQFLWGSYLLIAPVIYENHTSKNVYLPSLNERWFSYYTGEEELTLGNINVTADYDYLPLFLRGGAILPRQQSAMNTVKARLNPMNLIIALNKQEKAEGNLFWDDGDSIDTYKKLNYNYFYFNFNKETLSIQSWTYKYPQMGHHIKLDEIIIYGLTEQPIKIQWNGQDLSNNKWKFNITSKVLTMEKLALDFSQTHKFIFS
ncbi:unnamed protein product [Adineta steineri]|uniref:Maltase n=1 Tax=Adineta steineri TaxID=433720 RepID=A0A818U027_9BILA|nr:unnamed protein product [Adineta steineri]